MKCCICQKEISGFGNNPWPIKNEGKCCDECNAELVIPARINQLMRRKTMLHIKFKYKDDLSNGKWREQECTVSSLEECKKIYGLDVDPDCEYEIISIEEV